MMNSATRLMIVSFLLVIPVLQATPEATRIEFYYGIAQGNYLIGDLKGASIGVEQMLKLDPDYIPALTLNARILMDQNEPEAALSHIERAIELDRNHPEHQLLKALALGNLNRREDAIRIVEKVIQSTPAGSKQNHIASKLLGLLLMAEGNLDKAAEIFNQGYLNAPKTAQGNLELASEAYLQKANYALNKNDFTEALKAIDQALKLFKDQSDETYFQKFIQLAMLRARIQAQAGHMDEAIATLQSITSKQPNNAEALVTLASLYTSTGKWDLLQDILPDITMDPKLQDIALYLEGRISLEKGRIGTARETFESALRLLPDGPSKLRASLEFYQGICFLKMDQFEKGDAKIVQSIENGFRPENEAEAILASRALVRARKYQYAIAILEALTLNAVTESAEIWNLLGRAHLLNDSTTLALSAFNQSLTIQPGQFETLALRGSLLRKIGDLEGAAKDVERALDLAPENPALTFSLGLIYLQLSDLETAEKWIRQSTIHFSENPGVHLLHALLAYNLKSYDQAQVSLEAYLKLASEHPNESAFFLEYVLMALHKSKFAIDALSQRIHSADTATPLLSNFLAYIYGTLDRKAVLDAAGHGETPEIARKQMCETAYWLAQYERIHQRTDKADELLKLAIQIGSPDYQEYQFALWQLQ